MASLADSEENMGVGNVSGVDDRSGDSSGGGGVGDIEAPVAAAVNQTGSVPEHVVYNCRMCRRAVFNAADIQSHEAAQHNFHRRKVREKATGKTRRRVEPTDFTGLSVSQDCVGCLLCASCVCCCLSLSLSLGIHIFPTSRCCQKLALLVTDVVRLFVFRYTPLHAWKKNVLFELWITTHHLPPQVPGTATINTRRMSAVYFV